MIDHDLEPVARPRIYGTRPLSTEEAKTVPREGAPALKKIRDSHHRLARLIALGMRPMEVTELTGYSGNRIGLLMKDPSFGELVEHYRDVVDEQFRDATEEYYATVAQTRTTAARMLLDKLEDTEVEDIGFRDLVQIHADAADRTGYPKRSVAVNVNLDFAAKLDAAVRRSDSARVVSPTTLDAVPVAESEGMKVVGPSALPAPKVAPTSGGYRSNVVPLQPALIRRRA